MRKIINNIMNKTKVTSGSMVTLDGFTAGLNESLEKPFGDFDLKSVFRWRFDEPENHKREIDFHVDAGAFIMGSNMFGPEDERDKPEWKGWWGDNPPYHAPVFVLSHKEREPIKMEGGTTFYFVTDGIESALAKAKDAAGNRNVHIAGGANTVNQYLATGLIDEFWLHISPVTVGAGIRLFWGVPNLKLEPIEVNGTSAVTHIRYRIIK